MTTEITQPNAGTSARLNPENSKRELLYAFILVFFGITAVTLSQQNAIGLIPLKNLLKNELHEDRAATAAFFFWLSLAWYFKPFFGIFTDAFPFLGTRRKSYIVLGAVLSVVSFIALIYTPHRYAPLLAMCIAINVFMVISSTAVGGFMTEKAQSFKASGGFASVFQIAYQTAGVVGGPLGGMLAAMAFGWTGVASAAIMFLPIPAAIFFLKEKRVHIDSQKLLGDARKQLTKITKAKTMWAAAGFSFLFYFAPGISTALFYRQQNVLHMSTKQQGVMLFLNGMDWRIVSSAGQVIKTPIPGSGKPNPYCANFKPGDNNAEDPQSVASYIQFGMFRTVHLGDLTKNKEFELMCPNNPIGTVDLLLGLHHGVVTSNSEALVHALHPRVAIMNNGTRKGGVPEVMKTVYSSPGLEDLWEMHFSVLSGQEFTVPGIFIANMFDDQPPDMPIDPVEAPTPGPNAPPPPQHNGTAYWIKVSARQDGTFTVTNARNGFSKTYARIGG